MHATIGLAQLEKIDSILPKRRQLGQTYTRIIEELPNVTPAREPANYVQNYANYVIKFDVILNTDLIKKKLIERSIPTTISAYCIHKQPIYKGIKGDYPVAEYAYNYSFSLPINTLMNKDAVYYVCEILERFVL